jgi:hypothetical protein
MKIATVGAVRRNSVRLMAVLTLLGPLRDVRAQGEGPRVYLPVPASTQRLVATYLNITSNFNLQQVIYLPGASVQSHVGVLAYARFFGIAGHLSQVYAQGIYGSIGGSTVRVVNGVRAAVSAPRQSGFTNPLVGVVIGLAGTPALPRADFAKHRQTLQVSGLLEIAPKLGKYDEAFPLNPGTNRWTFRLGAPVVAPLGNPKRPVWLEVVPCVALFTTNDAPFGPAERRTQLPLWMMTTTASYNVTKKAWVALDLRGQAGGETSSDDVGDNNSIGTLALAGTAAYAFIPKLTGQVSYGGIFAKHETEHGDFLRLRLAYVF